jgi:hypothetical protein
MSQNQQKQQKKQPANKESHAKSVKVPEPSPVSSNNLQKAFEDIRKVEVTTSAKLYLQFSHEHISYEMIKTCMMYATKKIRHDQFCLDIVLNFLKAVKEPCKTDENFKKYFADKLVVFKNIASEYVKLDETSQNIFTLLLQLLNVVDVSADFEKARLWFSEKLEEVISQKFINAKARLIENVSLLGHKDH